jgi:uncharacterized protein (DUF2141 family)
LKKIISTVIIALFFGLVSQAQTVDLTVAISGFKDNTGKVMVGLYNSEGSFLESEIMGVTSKIKSKEATVSFKGLKKGEYAVSLYHDKNNNKKLDTNLFGIPKEDYACSNGAKGFMGPPKYVDAKFWLDKNSIITIKLNN